MVATPEPTEFDRLLDLLGIGPEERISVCSLNPGGVFHHATPQDRSDAVRTALSTPYKDRHVWFSPNPVRLPEGSYGRGGDEHVTRCTSLYADIDIKAGGVTDPEVAEKVALEISTALGVQPVAVVFTGHGGHAYWLLDPRDAAWTLDTDAKRAAAQSVYRRVHRMCAAVAEQHGCGVDNVAQLSRILRVPGTVNVKDPTNPVEVVLHEHPYEGSAGPLTYEMVCAAMDAYGILERPDDRDVMGEKVSDREGWEFGAQTHPYVTAMVAGWPSDPVKGSRHSWLVAQGTRLARSHRLGLVTEGDYADAVQTLHDSFVTKLMAGGEPRKPTPANEFESALDWGRDKAATGSDAQAADDLGLDLDGDGLPTMGERKCAPAMEVNLPEEFFDATANLQRLRDSALAHRVAPDAALMVVLTNLSARIPPGVRVDTGILQPLPLHLFGALACRTGKGKTSAMKALPALAKFSYSWSMDPFDQPIIGEEPEDLVQDPSCPVRYAIGDSFPRKGQIRSGEGIAEMFYDVVSRTSANGKKVTTRARVRTNVLMSTDEGAGLVKHILDDKQTVGETVRAAWSGSDFGQSNADSAKYRFIPEGEYTLALFSVFHLGTLATLMSPDQLALGTPQRFLLGWTRPDNKWVTKARARATMDPGPVPIIVPNTGLRLCRQIRERISEGHLEQWLADDNPDEDPVESQRDAMIGRVAGLMAIFNGRTDTDEDGLLVVTEQDWELATAIFETSCVIARLAVAERRASEAGRKRAARETELAESIEDEEARATPEGRVKARIIGSLRNLGPGEHKFSGQAGILRRFNTEDAKLANSVLPALVKEGRVAVREGARNSKFVTFLK